MSSTADAEILEERSPLLLLLDRLDEVRRRIAWTLAALIIGSVVSWGVSDRLFELLAQPLTLQLGAQGLDPRLTFTQLTDPFILYFTLALAGGAVLALPVLMAQIWLALSPRFRRRRTLSVFAFGVAAASLFIGGVSFCHQLLLPFAVAYLLEVGEAFQHALTVREYLRFSLRLLLALGLAAQLPLVSLTAARIGLIRARTLVRWLPYTILIVFMLAAWITPPDGLSQLLVAVPLLVLYVVGIGVAALAQPRE